MSASASDARVVDIGMPRLSDSMEEATILTWLKRPGDAVARGEPLVEVETDKATMVYESETAGVLEEIVVDDGSTADLGAVIARIRVGGAAAAPPTPAPAPAPAAEPASPSAATPRVEVEFRDAIRQALDEELARDERVFLFGEDVAVAGGVFAVTPGLYERHGPERVFDTPISELAMTGAAYGAAITGRRPVLEIMFGDFLALSMDTLINQASKYWFLTGGKQGVPLVIRSVVGGGGRFGAIHSQMPVSWLMGITGLKIVAPATPVDAKGLLKAAVRDENPVVFLEHKRLYSLKGAVGGDEVVPLGRARIAREGSRITLVSAMKGVHDCLAAADAKGLLKAAIRDSSPVVFLENEILYGQNFEVPKLEDFVIPIGKARIARAGKDVTVVSFSRGMAYALDAAKHLAEEGIEAEVIDLRTLRPLDIETMLASVRKTNRIVAIEEGWPVCSIASEIAARVTAEAFDYLDAPPLAVTGVDVPMPYAANLEKLALPSVEHVIEAVKSVCYRS